MSPRCPEAGGRPRRRPGRREPERLDAGVLAARLRLAGLQESVLLLAGLAAVWLLAGCAAARPPSHAADIEDLVGLSEAALISRLGQPDDRSGDISQSFLIYNHIDARYVHPSAGYRYDHSYDVGIGRPPSIASFDCRSTFVVRDGVVQAYDLSGIGCN